jgi:hypothetical protein
MSEKPVLDYEPRPPAPTRRQKIASIALVASCTLAAPSFVVVAYILALHDRYRLMNGEMVNQCLDAAMVCNAIGFILAILAFRLGKEFAGLLGLVHIISLVLLPSFGFA